MAESYPLDRSLTITDDLFFQNTELERQRVERTVSEVLKGSDDGELFLECNHSEHLSWEDGHLKQASFNTDQGFGLRVVAGEAVGYSHNSALSQAALDQAAGAIRAVHDGYGGLLSAPPAASTCMLYHPDNPTAQTPFEDKLRCLTLIDSYARSRDPRISQVTIALASSWQAVQIIRAGGHRVADVRPMVKLGLSVIAAQGDRTGTGMRGSGGRRQLLLAEENWRAYVDEAVRQALVNLEARPAPAGEVPVVLSPGWSGILLHEAVGHGLEGDFNRKQTSAFSGLMGEKVASSAVTVVDDGTIREQRGSISIDDEGTPSRSNTLIENGKLVGYLQDRMNARLMNLQPTGNGRRQSFAHTPMPRMTNTFMRSGQYEADEIISSVKKGLYAAGFSGGQVDITSGKFVFCLSEGYLIEDGKLGAPVRDATLIGNGPEVLKRVSMVGNDAKLDDGVGTCGKNGQWVPVGVGLPTILVDAITVGGTAC